MKLFVFSHPDQIRHEPSQVCELFEQGMDCFHLRKPQWQREQLRDFILSIPPNYRNQIMIHAHHDLAFEHELKGVHLTRGFLNECSDRAKSIKELRTNRPDLVISRSVHTLTELNLGLNYDYVFLSPIYESISKVGYRSTFTPKDVAVALNSTKQNVAALGGVSAEKLTELKELGFYGAAVLGTIWTDKKKPIHAFDELMKAKASLEADDR